MFELKKPSGSCLNIEEYRDKVLGCWTGKNIGGTIGAPFEGSREINDATFYTQDLKGNPIPNDDLDLQLVWLLAVVENGLFNINEKVLGEYWLTHITGPWNEYGVCKSNIRKGFYPPLSGSCNNDQWKYSNGAWIRSEIWACLFPGSIDEAVLYAYYDSCCDHCEEGIYAELFTAALESAAFIISDVRELIDIALTRIPADSRIARSVKIACDYYDQKKDFLEAREALVKDSEDLGWFQAPANIGYVIIGLLYGEGDFGRSVCLATNCGDDTDCTAGTVGAILGIIYGRSGLPAKWIEPIGDNIITCSIDTYGRNNQFKVPKTLDELTDAVVRVAVDACRQYPVFLNLGTEKSFVAENVKEMLRNPSAVVKRVWAREKYELSYALPYGTFYVNYENGPFVSEDEELKIRFYIGNIRYIEQIVTVRIIADDEWSYAPAKELVFVAKSGCENVSPVLTIKPANLSKPYYYLRAEITLEGRSDPTPITIPLQTRGSVNMGVGPCTYRSQDYWDRFNRIHAGFDCSRANQGIATII